MKYLMIHGKRILKLDPCAVNFHPPVIPIPIKPFFPCNCNYKLPDPNLPVLN